MLIRLNRNMWVKAGWTAALCLFAGACQFQDSAPSQQDTVEAASNGGDADTQPKSSIFAPDAGIETPDPVLEPLVLTIGFPNGDARLTAAQKAQIDAAVQSSQFAEGKKIVLRGHSDAGGEAEANMQASQNRADAVRDYLIAANADEERIITIGFGAQNPIEPNALPNGRPNEAGRMANRRVDMVILTDDSGDKEGDENSPSLLEQVADTVEEEN